MPAFLPGPIPHDVDTVAALRQSEILSDLSDTQLHELAGYVERLVLPARAVLFRQGDVGDALFLVVFGRLEVVVTGEDGQSVFVADVGRGECVGEMALLTDEPRSATIRASRDTVLLRLTRDRFQSLLRHQPGVSLHLTRLLASRLSVANAARRPGLQPSVIAIRAHAGDIDDRAFASALAAALRGLGPVAVLDSRLAEETLGDGCAQLGRAAPGSGRVAAWLDQVEAAHRFLLLVTDADDSAWTRRCLRQSDLVLLLASGAAPPAPALVAEHAGRRELVLLHASQIARPEGTRFWLDGDAYAAHHHVRLGRGLDYERLARHMAGHSIGLVLGGGGARGFAHIGVLRALEEAGIPVDRLGGASMGAVIGAQYAGGVAVSELVELNRLWAKHRVHAGYTLPVASIIDGNNGFRMLQQMFGAARIEDLWLPFYCVAANLTRAGSEVRRRGSLVHSLGASISLPGVAPPRVSPDGDLLVDGGLLDNVPASAMRALGAGPVIAVNVSPHIELKADPAYKRQPSSLRMLIDRLNPFSRVDPFPTIFRILHRATLLASIRQSQEVERQVDLYLTPDVSGFDIFDWKAVARLADTGHAYTKQRLASLQRGGPLPVPAGAARDVAAAAQDVAAAAQDVVGPVHDTVGAGTGQPLDART